MRSLQGAIHASLIYFVIAVCGIVYLRLTRDGIDSNAEFVARLWWVELLLCAYCVVYIAKGPGWSGAGFGRLRWSGLLWMLPSIWVLVAMGAVIVPVLLSDPPAPSMSRILALLAVSSLLIGFSEEVMFRGILLRAALTRLPMTQAILLSAAAFSLLHLVNGFGGEPFRNTLQQLMYTFLVGLALAPIALRLGSLWPLIIWHGLWDLVVFTSDALGVMYHFAETGMLIQVVFGMILWRRMLHERTPVRP